MLDKGQKLINQLDFDNAIYLGVNISVWIKGELIDYGGLIKSHNKDTVSINDGHYIKVNCEFRVR